MSSTLDIEIIYEIWFSVILMAQNLVRQTNIWKPKASAHQLWRFFVLLLYLVQNNARLQGIIYSLISFGTGS